MKTKNLFFIVSLTILLGFSTISAQTNAVYPANTTTPNGSNVSVGFNANQFLNAAATWNTFVGANACSTNTTGISNTFIGQQAGNGNTTGSNNIALGRGSLENFMSTNNQFNIGIGTDVGVNVSSSFNIFIGRTTGNNLTSGGGNTFIGHQIFMPTVAATATTAGNNTNNTLILGDGSGNQRIYAHNNSCVGLGLGNNQIPQNRLEINSTWNAAGIVPGTAGLRFRGFTNTNYNTAAPTSNRRVLTVNNNGDVILVDDVVGTGTGTNFTSTCGTNNFIPKSTGVNSMVCSQIFDDGASVGINTTGSFNYSNSTNPPFSGGSVPNTGVVRLDVNGVIRTTGIFATSDKKFKKEIKQIEGALSTIQAIDGKTYLWNKEANRDMDFDSGNHSGFIAQELEKVLPHLVITNDKGDKAVNYIELIPYLVEAIKEQQIQINDLKSQINENFISQNQDLILLENTKIISVSPNPSKDVIMVSFNIEKAVQNAKLEVFDLNGNLISSLNIKERETNLTRTFQRDNFGKGIYIVSLVINSKSIDSKKIVFE